MLAVLIIVCAIQTGACFIIDEPGFWYKSPVICEMNAQQRWREALALGWIQQIKDGYKYSVGCQITTVQI